MLTEEILARHVAGVDVAAEEIGMPAVQFCADCDAEWPCDAYQAATALREAEDRWANLQTRLAKIEADDAEDRSLAFFLLTEIIRDPDGETAALVDAEPLPGAGEEADR